jgi:hypothetical protein
VASSPLRAGEERIIGMAWYEGRPCAVCEKPIGRRFFWQDKPRLVDASGNAKDAAYLTEEEANRLAPHFVLACPSCYFGRFGDAKLAAAKRAAQ